MYTLKVLDEGERDILRTVAPEDLVPQAESAIPVVAMEEGKVVACAFLVIRPSIEGAWCAPEWESSGVAEEIDSFLREHAAETYLGLPMYAYAANRTIERHLAGQGYRKLRLSVWERKTQ